MRLATLTQTSCLAALLFSLFGVTVPAHADAADKLVEKVREQVVAINAEKENLKYLRIEFTDRMDEVMLLRMRLETGGDPKQIAFKLMSVQSRIDRSEGSLVTCKETLGRVHGKLDRFKERAQKLDDRYAKRTVKRAQRQLFRTEAQWERTCTRMDDVKFEIDRLFDDLTEP